MIKLGYCLYFNTPEGCRYGDHCVFKHAAGKFPVCRFYSRPNGCLNGNKCRFAHIGDKIPCGSVIKSDRVEQFV